MNAEKELEEITLNFENIYSKKYGNIFLSEDKSIIICELTVDYVPIESFKKLFSKLSEHIKEYNVAKFVFDKRSLKTFHQPSMEWYFLTWKEEMFQFGMKVHRKILPPGDVWFKEAVLAGRDRILSNNPDNIIDQLDIQYRDSLKEAIEN